MLGVEKYTENFVEDALELLTISYVVNEKIIEDPPISNCKVKEKKLCLKPDYTSRCGYRIIFLYLYKG